ncbi:MAG: PEP-CTERM sorting domain-containing protein [Pirellulales bacterium]|nr:PEP-CTERM sorting domain-containing protein [Pirellulales bacterium]
MRSRFQTLCVANLAVALLLSIGATMLQADTVAYWRFENDPGFLKDSGPYNLDLTPIAGDDDAPWQYELPDTGIGSAFPDPIPLVGPNAYSSSMDHSLDGFTGADNSVLHFTEGFTIEVFFNREQSSADHRVVYRQFSVGAGGEPSNQRSVKFALAKGDSTYRRCLEIVLSSDGVEWPYVRSNNLDSQLVYQDGKDYYAAVSVDLINETVTFYLKNLTDDGELLSASTASPVSSLHDSTANFYLGKNHGTMATPGLGDYLDEIRISNVALGEADLLINQVPEPSTLALLACGLIGLLAYAWRKRK